jgi:hypothetical protein
MTTIEVQTIKNFLSDIESLFYKIVLDTDSWNEYHRLNELYFGENQEALKEIPTDFIVIKWQIEDVQSVRPDLSDDEANEVLGSLEDNHDANVGINWEVIEYAADNLFPEPANLQELKDQRDALEFPEV